MKRCECTENGDCPHKALWHVTFKRPVAVKPEMDLCQRHFEHALYMVSKVDPVNFLVEVQRNVEVEHG